jgi:hypothetical protein
VAGDFFALQRAGKIVTGRLRADSTIQLSS